MQLATPSTEGNGMSINKEEIGKTILELEKTFNERWSVGDNRGYLDNYAEEISYFDPVLKEHIVGRDAVIAHIESLYSNPHIVRNEYLNPAVNVSDSGDFAVLAYNLDTYVLDDNGDEQQLRAWNATEAYRLIDGEWRIVHSHWAFTETATEAVAS
jgi:ketosteroid isomerase-like protein